MPLLSPTACFEHRIEWSIENFHLCPHWEDLYITSPGFDIRLLEVITLKFSIQDQGPGNSMLFCVHCEGNVDAFRVQFPSIEVGLLARGTQNVASSNKSNAPPPVKRPLFPLAVACFVMNGLYPGMQLVGETLVLLVTLKTKVQQNRYWSIMMDPHLVYLATDVVSMVTRPLNPDYVIQSKAEEPKQGPSFDAHSCILRARIPILFQDQVDSAFSDTGSSSGISVRPMDIDHPVFETGMSAETTKTLINYLYGRLASTIRADQRMELLNFAQIYQMKDLERMLKSYPSEYSLRTTLFTDDISFNIIVADMCENPSTPKMYFPDPRNIKGAVSWKVASDKSIEFTFFLESYPQVPTHMKLTIQLKSSSGQELKEQVLWHTFTNNKFWITPAVATTTDYVCQPHLIVCRVQMAEGRFGHKEGVERTMEEATEGRLVVFNNILTLSQQLGRLYLDRVGCDFELHVGAAVFRVHKAIVVARSPMIRRMVQKKEDFPHDSKVVKVKLNQFPLDCYNEVIFYMYSGRIRPNTPEHMDDLAAVADHLDMPFLVEHCIFLKLDGAA